MSSAFSLAKRYETSATRACAPEPLLTHTWRCAASCEDACSCFMSYATTLHQHVMTARQLSKKSRKCISCSDFQRPPKNDALWSRFRFSLVLSFKSFG
mmetsp:Transcript_1691/g.4349  ORF Transcript_1691/g.4349 Transcript_1691/m.4349 type:complete len:98 (-) Transcript_1691:633-926(-)